MLLAFFCWFGNVPDIEAVVCFLVADDRDNRLVVMFVLGLVVACALGSVVMIVLGLVVMFFGVDREN